MATMNTIRFACPSCGQHLACDDNAKGLQIQCPACNQAVVVPTALVGIPLPQASAAPSALPQPPSQAPQPSQAAQSHAAKPQLTWVCEECGTEFQAPYDDYGKSIECSYCHQISKVAKQSPKVQEPQVTTGQADSQSPNEECAAQKTLNGTEGVFLFLGVLYALGALTSFMLSTYRDESQKGQLLEGMVGGFLAVFYIVGGHLLVKRRSIKLAVTFLCLLGLSLLVCGGICLVGLFEGLATGGEGWLWPWLQFACLSFIAALGLWNSVRAYQATMKLYSLHAPTNTVAEQGHAVRQQDKTGNADKTKASGIFPRSALAWSLCGLALLLLGGLAAFAIKRYANREETVILTREEFQDIYGVRIRPDEPVPPMRLSQLPEGYLQNRKVTGHTTAAAPQPVRASSQARNSFPHPVLGAGTSKDILEKMFVGRTRAEIKTALGPPDEAENNGVQWIYDKGVYVYDADADLTFRAYELVFDLLPGPSLRAGNTVEGAHPLSTPQPIRGHVK